MHRTYGCPANPDRCRPQCHLCGKDFSQPQKLKAHIEAEHAGTDFVHCGNPSLHLIRHSVQLIAVQSLMRLHIVAGLSLHVETVETFLRIFLGKCRRNSNGLRGGGLAAAAAAAAAGKRGRR